MSTQLILLRKCRFPRCRFARTTLLSALLLISGSVSPGCSSFTPTTVSMLHAIVSRPGETQADISYMGSDAESHYVVMRRSLLDRGRYFQIARREWTPDEEHPYSRRPADWKKIDPGSLLLQARLNALSAD